MAGLGWRDDEAPTDGGPSRDRVDPVREPYDDRLAAAFAAAIPLPTPPLRLYRQVARCAPLFVRLVEGGILGPRGLLWLDRMDRTERELAILRTTARMRAGYEWSVHVAYFRGAGLDRDRIAATCRAAIDPDLWSPRQVAILRLVDGAVEESDWPDDLWFALQAELQNDEIVEFVTLVGLYRTVSTLAVMMRTTPEPDTPPFPGWSSGEDNRSGSGKEETGS